MTHPLRTERERQNLTINELADAADVNEKSVRRGESWEPVSAETRAKLATALGVEVESIWPRVEIGSIVAGQSGSARIAGMTASGNYVLQPMEFGPMVEISAADLKARFALDVVAAGTQSERRGFAALAAASARNAAEIEQQQRAGAAEQARVEHAEAAGWDAMAAAMDETR